MMNRAIFTDYIVGTHLGSLNSKCMQGFRASVLSRMMNDYKIWSPQIKIDRTDKGRILQGKIICRRLLDLLCPDLLPGSYTFCWILCKDCGCNQEREYRKQEGFFLT